MRTDSYTVTQLWDFVADVCLEELSGTQGRVVKRAECNSGTFLITAQQDNSVIMWNLGNGPASWLLGSHEGAVTDICLCPEEKNAISVSHDMTLRIWDLQTKECANICHFNAPLTCVTVVSMSRIVVVDEKCVVHFLDW